MVGAASSHVLGSLPLSLIVIVMEKGHKRLVSLYLVSMGKGLSTIKVRSSSFLIVIVR